MGRAIFGTPVVVQANRALEEDLGRKPSRAELGRELMVRAVGRALGRPEAGDLVFHCNICDHPAHAPLGQFTREKPTCGHCGSTVRWRAIVHVLSQALFGQDLRLSQLPRRPDLVGLGLTDWRGYAEPLSRRFSYTNTYYHCEPRLDILDVEPARRHSADFLISSEVFEHVPPPASRAFTGAAEILKPGGLLLLTVPYVTTSQPTIEHYPTLHSFHIEQTADGPVLLNTRVDGVEERFENPLFHDGLGLTLEMRVFSRDSLTAELLAAGFEDVKFWDQTCHPHGIVWQDQAHLPVTARRPRS